MLSGVGGEPWRAGEKVAGAVHGREGGGMGWSVAHVRAHSGIVTLITGANTAPPGPRKHCQ